VTVGRVGVGGHSAQGSRPQALRCSELALGSYSSQFKVERQYQPIRMVAGRRNQSFLSFNHFRKACNHPNLYAAVEIRESCV